jgi:hypothetical protein
VVVSARDSAGIRVVDNSDVRDAEPRWGVVPEPVFRLGWEQGDPPFQRIRSGVIMPNGQVVVVDRGSQLVHFVAIDGTHLRSVGGEGDGPGEFRAAGNIVRLAGDSVLVSDGGNQRFTVFVGQTAAADGRFANRFSAALYEPIGRSSAGEFLLAPVAFAAREIAAGWSTYPVLRTRDFVTVDTIAHFPLIHSQGNRNPIRQYGAVVAAGDGLAVAKTDEPQVAWIDTDGTPTQIARWDLYPRAVSEDDWPAFDREMRERLSDAGSERLEQQMAEWHADFGGTTPMFGVAHGDREGNVWLSQYEFLSASTTVYRVVSSEGEWLGTVTFSRDIRILDITDDRVLGVEANDLGVEAVVVYELHKSGN